MSLSSKFTGLGVALVTPFLDNGAIDYESLDRLLDHLIIGQADFLVIHGTTGESPCLTRDERNQVTRKVIQRVQGKLPIVIGLGGNNTIELGKRFEELDTEGIDGILSVVPFYNKPSQEGLYQHFSYIAKCSKLPIILYNVPGRVGINLNPETVIRLAKEHELIVGVKEASGFVSQGEQVASAMHGEDFVVLSGDDALSTAFIRNGAKGVISVAGNAFPKLFGKLIHLAMEGKLNEAEMIQERFSKLNTSLFANGNPAGIKALLKDMELIKYNSLRLPLVPASKETILALEDARASLEVYTRMEYPELI